MAKKALKVNSHIFGLPYQFPASVDPRMDGVSKFFGRMFAENIMASAPIITFLPGTPQYLANNSKPKKVNASLALLNNNGYFNKINGKSLKKPKFSDLRLYEFSNNYSEYIKYVNVLCRTGAIYLNLGDTKLGDTKLRDFNWKDYNPYKNTKTKSITVKSQKKKGKLKFTKNTGAKASTLANAAKNKSFVQFYIDADVSASDSFGNQTSTSMMKGLLDTGSETMKEIAFMANSGLGGEALSGFVADSAEAMTAGIEQILGGNTISNGLSRIINLGTETLRGNNIIMPDVYQSSSYMKNYTIRVHLKSPYGTKLGYYLNIFVPLMHILALALPRQASANSYSAPFIVKAYVDSIFSCNMGIIAGVSINRVSESMSVEGLPSEVDVDIDLTDLYSGIQMSSADNPLLFMCNSSLQEFLAVNCGLSLIDSSFKTKFKNLANNLARIALDKPGQVTQAIDESIHKQVDKILKLYY